MSDRIMNSQTTRRGFFLAGAGALGAIVVAATGAKRGEADKQTYYTPGTQQHRDEAGCACPICTSTDRGREAMA